MPTIQRFSNGWFTPENSWVERRIYLWVGEEAKRMSFARKEMNEMNEVNDSEMQGMISIWASSKHVKIADLITFASQNEFCDGSHVEHLLQA